MRGRVKPRTLESKQSVYVFGVPALQAARSSLNVMPANAGIQKKDDWIPAFAGMTEEQRRLGGPHLACHQVKHVREERKLIVR